MRVLVPVLFAIATGFCWGLYGPILAKARQVEPSIGPFKPYVAIGVAYLVIAIIGGIIGMMVRGDSFQFSGPGNFWGLAAGSLGAVGALTLTLCMFKGGSAMPHAMMPIVFGFAVTVTAIYTVLTSGGRFQFNPMLIVGIIGMLVSVVIITTNTPHATAAPPAGQGGSASSSAGQPIEMAHRS